MAKGSGGVLTNGITIFFKSDTAGLTGGVNQAKGILSGIADAAGPVGIAMAAIGTAVVGVGIAATKMAADYEQSMNKVQALTGASTDQMSQFDAGLKQLAMDTGVAPKQLADGLYNVISAGYQGKDAMTVLALATKDSVIGMTDAKVTTDALTNVLASFSLGAKDANRVNGEMLETVTLGKSTFEQYANSIVKSASSASQFGVSMETMNAAFATMTSSGIKAAQASTDFQQSLKVMYGNIGTVTKSLQSNNIAFDEAKFNTLDYGGKVQMLNSALEEANAKHVKVTGVTLQAAQAIHTIATHIDTYNTDLKKLSDQQAMAAKTQEAWSITLGGFNVSLQRLKATAQVVMIDIGQQILPIATKGVNLLSDGLHGLMDIGGKASDAIKRFGESLDHVGIKGAIANFEYFDRQIKNVFATVGIFGKYIIDELMPPMTKTSDLAAKVSTDIRKLGDWFWDTGVKVKNFENALLGAGPTVEQIVANIKKAENAFTQFGPPLQNIANLLKNELGKELKDVGDDAKQIGDWFMKSVVPALKQAEPGFKNLANVLLTNVLPAIIQVRGVFVDVVQHAFVVLGPIVEKIVPPLIKLAGTLANDLANGLKVVTPVLKDATTALGNFAKEITDRVAPVINNILIPGVKTLYNIWKTVWPGIADTVHGVWDMIVGVVKIGWGLVSGIIKIGLDILSMNWKQAWTDMWNMIKQVWDGTQQLLKGGWEVIKGIVKTMVEGIVGFFKWLWDQLVGHSIIPDMINGIISWFAKLPASLWGIVQNAANFVTTGFRILWAAIVVTVTNIYNDVVNWFSKIPQGVMNVLNGLPGMIQNLWNTIINDAKNAGANIMNGIASGIRGAIGAVTGAISDVTSWISAHLPHSPAKVGPLRDLAYQGSQIPEQISQGMIAGIPRIQSALNRMTTPIALNFQYPTPGVASGGAPVIHVHVNSQATPIYLDGHEITNRLGPHIANMIRVKGNVRAH